MLVSVCPPDSFVGFWRKLRLLERTGIKFFDNVEFVHSSFAVQLYVGWERTTLCSAGDSRLNNKWTTIETIYSS